MTNQTPAQTSSIPGETRRPWWRPWSGPSLLPIFIALAGALAGLALLMGQTIVAQREARAQATVERGVLIALNDLMLAVVAAESGQRGFVLTGERVYLDPYLAARPLCAQAIATIRDLGAQSGGATAQADDAGRLQQLVAAKFIEMDRTVRLGEAGMHDQALAIIKADLGRIQMTAIRREVARQAAERETLRQVAMTRLDAAERRLLPLIGVLGAAILVLVHVGLRAERSRAQAAAQAGQAAVLRDANQRTELLARELNHRIKNLFAVILAIVSLSARKQAPTSEVVDDIRARIRALSLAHDASQGGDDGGTAVLDQLIVKTMGPYADAAGQRVRVGGPQVALPMEMVTPIGLIIHELATNAVKHGALSVDEGTVDIGWQVVPTTPGIREVHLRWVENGGPPTAADVRSASGGFGSRMTTLAAGQLGGTLERDWPVSGAVVRLRFAVPDASPRALSQA